MDAIIFEFDDLAPLDRWSTQLAGLLEEGAGRIPEDADAAAAGAMARALLLRDAGNPALEGWIERARLPLARAVAALLRGDLAMAGATVETARSRARALPPRFAVAAAIAAALHHLLDGAHLRALETAQTCLTLAESEGMRGYERWLRALAAAAALGAGERDAARAEVLRLEADAAAPRRGDRAILHYLRGWLAAAEGDPEGALRDARAAVALAAETGLPWLECLSRSALGRCLADAGDRRSAEVQLRAAQAIADAQQSAFLVFCIQLTGADAALCARDEAAALACLRSAFALGRAHGFRHAPWWRQRETAELCALAMHRGIEPEYASALVRERRLVPRVAPLRIAGWPWPFRIATLGRFELLRAGAPVEFSAKGPGRPMELLKVLVALGGQNVRADHLGDALWPHVDADYAHKSFTATLHRLRRLLGDDEALQLREGRLSLGAGLVWVDAWALEAVLSELEGVLRAPPHAGRAPELRTLVDEAFALYRGPFLPDESDQPSYLASREQIRARLLRCLARAARAFEEDGDTASGADCYQRLIDADPLYEAPYRNLMLACKRAGDLEEARAAYERLRAILANRLKVMPSAETQAVYAELGGNPPG